MKGDPLTLERLKQESRSEIAIPQPACAEIEYGIERLPKSKRKVLLKERWETVSETFARSLWTDEVSECFGEIKAALERKGERIEDFDAAIAAHALTNGAVLVTANRKHMTRVPGLMVEDWSRV